MREFFLTTASFLVTLLMPSADPSMQAVGGPGNAVARVP